MPDIDVDDRGSAALLAFIYLGNLANLSFLAPAIPGQEKCLAGRPNTRAERPP